MADSPTPIPSDLVWSLRYLATHVATGVDLAGAGRTLAEQFAAATGAIDAAERDDRLDGGRAGRARAVTELLMGGVPVPRFERLVFERLVDDVVEFRRAVTVLSAETILQIVRDMDRDGEREGMLEHRLAQLLALKTVPSRVDAAPDADMVTALDIAVGAVRGALSNISLPLPDPWAAAVAAGTCHGVDRAILPGAAYRNADAESDGITRQFAEEVWIMAPAERPGAVTSTELLILLADLAEDIQLPHGFTAEHSAALKELQGRAAQLSNNPGLSARVAGVAAILAADPTLATECNVAAQAADPDKYANLAARHRDRRVAVIRAGIDNGFDTSAGAQTMSRAQAHTMAAHVREVMLSVPAGLGIAKDTGLGRTIIDHAQALHQVLTRKIDTVPATSAVGNGLNGVIAHTAAATDPVASSGVADADLVEDAAVVATGAEVMRVRAGAVGDAGAKLTTTTDDGVGAEVPGLR